MATFKVRIEDLIGAVGDDNALSDWLTEGARHVADSIKRTERLILYATDKTDSGSGIAITGGRPLSAHKSGYEARLILIGQRAKALDGDSRHYALASDPQWYMDVSKGYVIPGGGTIKWFGYPTVAYGDSTITNYPSEALGTIVLYAAVQGGIRILSDLTTTTLGGITFASGAIDQAAPSVPSFTWTDAQAATVGLSSIPFIDNLSFTPPVFAGSYTSIDTALGNQDIELAAGYNQKVQNQLNQYSQDLQNSVAQFQKDLQEYQLGLQKATQQAQLDSQRLTQQAQLTNDINMQNEIYTLKEQVDEYTAKLGKYQADVSYYGTQVQVETSRVQFLIAKYTSMAQNYLQILENLRKEFQTSLESL